MRVLWFEVTTPSAYDIGGTPLGGWQDSLERIVRTIPEIELSVAFMSDKDIEVREIDGVKYMPISCTMTIWERLFYPRWDIFVKKLIAAAKTIIDQSNPDLIHIFGTEWPFGQVATITNVPVIIHIQGAIVPYNNALLPPGYSFFEEFLRKIFSPLQLLKFLLEYRDNKNREVWERKTWSLVSNYMGRTCWDHALANVLHPQCLYFHVEEALRASFTDSSKKWNCRDSGKIQLLSTGCGDYRKGPDMLIKTAKILTGLKVSFEWIVAGGMPVSLIKDVERKSGCTFSECNVRFIGFANTDKLKDLLCSSTIYVHTAYMENSPNSICEAQILGVPVVSTNVGGIASLIRDGVDGILVPANDPWFMAYSIVRLINDKSLMLKMSHNSSSFAKERHDDNNIKKQLLAAYKSIV